MERYFIVWAFSWVLVGLGIVAWLGALGVIIWAMQNAQAVQNMANQLTQLLGPEWGGLVGRTVEAAVVELVVRLVIYGLGLMASGQFLMMLMDWAEDTRVLAACKQHEMIERRRPDLRP